MEAKFRCFSFQMAGDRELPGLGGEERGGLGEGSLVRIVRHQRAGGWGFFFHGSSSQRGKEEEERVQPSEGRDGVVFRCNGM